MGWGAVGEALFAAVCPGQEGLRFAGVFFAVHVRVVGERGFETACVPFESALRSGCHATDSFVDVDEDVGFVDDFFADEFFYHVFECDYA